MPKKSNRHKLVVQFVEYMVSGGVYFWIGYAILNYLYYAAHWSLWWATILSNLIGWTANFILQRFWVFNNKSLKGHQTQVTGRYAAITLVDFVLNYFILYGLKQIGITPAIGQFISSGFFTVWNWFWYKLWVFPEHMKKRKTVITPARIVAHRAHGHLAYHKVTG
ncbi:MAG TPA: GtrA family protein [Candidatus Saccharimonadales bacterium]|nr:GtrA family protein [Candidatus Saccharimonadales bacterium]